MKVFNSVSDLQAASLTAGQLTQTKRYFAGQDGGGATYLIKTAVDYAGTPDELTDFTLANGNVASIHYASSDYIKNTPLGGGPDVTLQATLNTIEGDIDALQSVTPTADIGKVKADALPVGSIDIPNTFNNTLGVSIYWDGTAVRCTQSPYDLIDFEKWATVTNYYVNYAAGTDGGAGTGSGASAWKTLDYAVANAVSPAIINIEDEWIGYLSSGSTPKSFTGQLKIKSVHSSGRTIIAAMRESYDVASFSWASSGASNAYVSSTASAKYYRSQVDTKYKDVNGIPRPITNAGSQAACETTPGTFYWSGSALYVHMWDGRIPDPADGWMYSESPYDFEIQQGGTSASDIILLENMKFLSNNGATTSGAGMRYRPVTTGSATAAMFGCKNCLVYGNHDNGFEIYDADVVVMEDCHARYNRADGLNYHSFVTTGTKGEYMTVYEYNCTSFDSGFGGWADQIALGTSTNGSTSHDSLHIIRINTVAGGCNGAVIADVNGVHSLNYNVTASHPDDGGTSAWPYCFWHEKYLTAGATNIMYLWGCSAHTDEDVSVDIISNLNQAGGSASDGEIRVKYWQGEITDQVVGTLYDWSGTAL